MKTMMTSQQVAAVRRRKLRRASEAEATGHEEAARRLGILLGLDNVFDEPASPSDAEVSQ